jgi:N-acetylglucosaminyl-diphospho-decaprenol L-rhamnosyltransferase
MTMRASSLVMVLYGTDQLELDWVPDDTPIILVHNDRRLDPTLVHADGVAHLMAERNLGFGGGVNLGLSEVDTPRTVICNPDTELSAMHWDALQSDDPDEVRAIALDDATGRPTAVVNPYPSAFGHLAAGWRLGRVFPRGSRRRELFGRLAGGWARANVESFALTSGRWSLRTHWISGAVFSIDTERLRSVGGFDDRYFLYFEDIDLCRRLGVTFPEMAIVMTPVPAGVHAVGGSTDSTGSGRRTRSMHLASARRYAAQQPGWSWAVCRAGLAARALIDRRP